MVENFGERLAANSLEPGLSAIETLDPMAKRQSSHRPDTYIKREKLKQRANPQEA